MRCPNCQAENPDSAAVCQQCGAGLKPVTPPTDRERAQQLLDEAFRLSDDGQLTEAIAACRRAVSVNPNSTSAHSLLGILYERSGQRDLAIQAYEAALRLSPQSTADRESLRQLLAPPGAPVVEVAAPAAVPGPTAVPPPRRGIAPLWYGVAAVAALLLILLAFAFRAWRAASVRPPTPTPAVIAQPTPTPAVTPTVSPPPARVAVAAPRPPVVPASASGLPTSPLYSGQRAAAPGPRSFALTPAPPPAQPRAPIIPAPLIFRPATTTPRPPSAPPAPTVTVAPAPPVSVAGARQRYLEGDLAGAVRTMERAISSDPQADAATIQDLGWLYYRSGRAADAALAYRESLDRYQEQAQTGRDGEAARRGISTAQAALRVLELYQESN